MDDDDPFGGGLDFSRNQAAGQPASSAYGGGGGMSFGGDDDPFADDVPGGSLELDLPPSHAARSARSLPAASGREPPPDREVVPPRNASPSGPLSGGGKAASPIGPTSGSLRSAPHVSHAPGSLGQPTPASSAGPESAPTKPRSADPAELIARYPAAPDKVWEAPAYAVKILLRQLELRQDLASLRKRRSPDVALYERALTVHDKKTFALGMLIVGAGLAIATVLFFLPVILRFTQAPD